MDSALMFSSKRQDWATPRSIFRELDYVYHFDLDACASENTAKCENYFTEADNALEQDWSQYRSVFMNPPYGKEIGRLLRKAFESAGSDTVVVCLVPSRTDTAWWHDYCMKGKITFIRGRIRFDGHKNSAPFPSAVVVFGGRLADNKGEG